MTNQNTLIIIVIVAIAIACVCVIASNSDGMQNIQGAQVTTIRDLLNKPESVKPDLYPSSPSEYEPVPSEGLFSRKKSNVDVAAKLLGKDAPFFKQVCFDAAQSLIPMYGPQEFLNPSSLEFSLSDSVSLLCEIDFKKMLEGIQFASPEKALEGVEAGIKIKLP
ncbi:hypothetical protein KY325_00285 [Candidatus Woesearchaeota archaeon]|nr:hypothetical protein [Candidatus Woesearchaeota archaeon]